MSLLDRSRVSLRNNSARAKTYFRDTPKTKLGFQAVLGAFVLAGASSLGSHAADGVKWLYHTAFERTAKPDTVEGEWKGIYYSPQSESRTKEQFNAAEMCHEKGVQTWKIDQSGRKIIAKITEPGKRGKPQLEYDTSGYLGANLTLTSTSLGAKGAVWTVYLWRHASKGYYLGYAYLWDGNAFDANATMVCPYVLYKADNTTQQDDAETERLIAGDPRCRSVASNFVIPPMPAASQPCTP